MKEKKVLFECQQPNRETPRAERKNPRGKKVNAASHRQLRLLDSTL
jgi:hypothetical protein